MQVNGLKFHQDSANMSRLQGAVEKQPGHALRQVLGTPMCKANSEQTVNLAEIPEKISRNYFRCKFGEKFYRKLLLKFPLLQLIAAENYNAGNIRKSLKHSGNKCLAKTTGASGNQNAGT